MAEKLGLTWQHLRVLRLSANGHSNKEIARILGISHRTVESHRNMIVHRLGARNITHAVAIGLSERLIAPTEIVSTSPEPVSRLIVQQTKLQKVLVELIALVDQTLADISSTSDEPPPISQVDDHQTRTQ